MQRKFYNLDGEHLTDCDCNIEAKCCKALIGVQFDTEYNRAIDTETVHIKQPIDNKTFCQTIYKLRNALVNPCGNNEQFLNYPWNMLWGRATRVDIHKMGLDSVVCMQSIRDGTDNFTGCAILVEYDSNDINYRVLKDYAHDTVGVYPYRVPDDKLWLFDSLVRRGICAECKWHPKVETGVFKDCISKIQLNNCDIKGDECPAHKMMLTDNYTSYEIKVRCLGCARKMYLQQGLGR